MDHIISFFTHIDAKHVNDFAAQLGPWLYVTLFGIIFAETGLVVTPFLPGDSLLFAIGAACGIAGSPLDIAIVLPLLVVAAIVGDALNYAIGAKIGPAVFTSETSRLLNRKHLYRTQDFYERYGGKAIIIARFAPILRTFAPFVAGIGKMRYPRFLAFNVVGAVAWVSLMTLAGKFFGELEVVKKRFHLVVFAIIFISILPAVIEFAREYTRAKRPPAT
ncbi:MAG TPA: DedA family protein [Polyangiaceae bacterium]|nr:DedA family protein [Polyangiaceae bacterium]